MDSPTIRPKMALRSSASLAEKQDRLNGNSATELRDVKREMLEAFGTSRTLEVEYIRSLHRQIYLFEIENKFLRKELEKIALQSKHNHSERKKTNDRSVSVDMIGEKPIFINELVRECDGIQAKLNGEIALRKEQMDIFTQDILKLKDEKEAILRESKQKDKVIEELNRSTDAWRNQLMNFEEKFEACKQALTMEIRRRKILERRLADQNTSFSKVEEIPNQKKNAAPAPAPATKPSSPTFGNNVELDKSISELSKLVIGQTQELKELKRFLYQAEAQRRINETADFDSSKTQKDYPDHFKVNTSTTSSTVRKRWQDLEVPRNFDDGSVREDPIQPIKRKKPPTFKT